MAVMGVCAAWPMSACVAAGSVAWLPQAVANNSIKLQASRTPHLVNCRMFKMQSLRITRENSHLPRLIEGYDIKRLGGLPFNLHTG